MTGSVQTWGANLVTGAVQTGEANLQVMLVHVTEPAGVEVEDANAAAHRDVVPAAVQRRQVHQHRPEALLDLEPQKHNTSTDQGQLGIPFPVWDHILLKKKLIIIFWNYDICKIFIPSHLY